MIQRQTETSPATTEISDSRLEERVDRIAEAVAGLKIRVVSEVVPLGLWAVEQLQKAGHRVEFERGPATHFSLRHRSSLGVEPLRKLLQCIRPFYAENIEPVPYFYGEIDAELYLGGATTEELRLYIQTDSSRMLSEMGGLARDCGLATHHLSRQQIAENTLTLSDAVGPFERALLIWMTERISREFRLIYTDQHGDSRMAMLALRDPTLLELPIEQRYPVVVEGDNPAAMKQMQSWLESRGCLVELDSQTTFPDPDEARLEVVNGPFRSLEGRAFVEEIAARLRGLAGELGIDPSRYPVHLRKELSDDGVLRVRMPTRACLERTARAWGGPHPERFNVKVFTDNQRDPIVRRLVSRLHRCGLTLVEMETLKGIHEQDEQEVLLTPEPGVVQVGDLANYPAILQRVVRSVNRALEQFRSPREFSCDVQKAFGDDDFDIRIFLPTVGMRSGKYRSRLLSPGHYNVSLFSPSPGFWEPLRRALEAKGFAVNLRSGSKSNPAIRYGGAKPVIIEQVEDTIRQCWGRSPMAIKVWPNHDRDIHINLPELDTPLDPQVSIGMQSDPDEDDGEDFDCDVMDVEESEVGPRSELAAPKMRGSSQRPYIDKIESRSFIEVSGDRLLVGPLRLQRRVGGEFTGVPPIDPGYCVDSLTAQTLLHIAQSVRLREPCLLEGETASSKTSAIVHLAGWLNQPLKRINLNGQTDTGDLIGRFVPNAEASSPKRRSSSRSAGLGWRWMEGDLIRALRKGWWILLDEVNLAEPQILERLNSLLEFSPSLVVTEFDGERFGAGGTEIHPDFRIFATMNPADYAGRTSLSPAYKDRWSGYLLTPSPSEREYHEMLRQLVLGKLPEVYCGKAGYRGADREPLSAALANQPQIHRFLQGLARFHASLETAAGQCTATAGVLGADRKEKPVFTRRALLSVVSFLAKSAESAEFELRSASETALARYYLTRATSPADRATIEDLLNACGIGPTCWSL